VTSKDQDFLEFVIDQMSGLTGVVSRRMFGAIGLYKGDVFFAVIDDGTLYFVTDESTRGRYIERGMGPFEYTPGKFLRTYYEVPVDVLENDRDLSEWANEAVRAQATRSAAKAGKKHAGSSKRAIGRGKTPTRRPRTK